VVAGAVEPFECEEVLGLRWSDVDLDAERAYQAGARKELGIVTVNLSPANLLPELALEVRCATSRHVEREEA
jgi:hypothetical protein